jgi:hypothetical protein
MVVTWSAVVYFLRCKPTLVGIKSQGSKVVNSFPKYSLSIISYLADMLVDNSGIPSVTRLSATGIDCSAQTPFARKVSESRTDIKSFIGEGCT